MINGTVTEPLRGGPSSLPIKKKKNRKGKKKTVVADGDSDSSSDGDELDYFATGGGASSSIVSQVRSKKPTAASGADVQDKTVPSHQLAAFQEALIVDPIELVVRDVLTASKGDFSAGNIRDCVSRMFDEGKNYDNTAAVIKQLKIERGDVIKEEKPTEAAKAAAVAARKEAQLAAPPPVPPTKITSARAAAGNTAAVKSNPPITKFARPGANDTTGVHAKPMGNKLEIAATHQPLSAGLEALCSWAHIVGPEKAPAQFFAPDCKAVELIMLSLVNDPSIFAKDPKARTNLLMLLQKVLVGNSADANALFVSKIISDIETVLNKAQSARTVSGMQLLKKDGAAGKALADNLGALIRRLYQSNKPEAAVVGDVDGEQRKSESDTIAESITKLEREIKILNSRAPKISPEQAKEKSPTSLKQLFAAREAHHEIMGLRKQIAELTARASFLEAANGNGAAPKILPSKNVRPDDIKCATPDQLANDILAEVGESTTTLSMKKTEAATAQSDLMKVGDKNQSAAKLNDIKLCDEKLSEYLIQKSQLELQLAAIERDMALVTSRRDALRNEYVTVSSNNIDKMSRLAAAKSESERTDMLDTTVRSVTSSYAALDRNIRDIEEELTAIMQANGADGDDVKGARSGAAEALDVSEKRSQTLQAFNSYVSSEVACIDALISRIVDLRNKQVLKNREILEYQRIGIEALVAELRRDLEKLSGDCTEDIGTVRALQECLVEVVKSMLTPADLALADKEGSSSVWTESRNLVGGVIVTLTAAQLPVHPVLSKFGVSKAKPPAVPATVAADSPSKLKQSTTTTTRTASSPWGAKVAEVKAHEVVVAASAPEAVTSPEPGTANSRVADDAPLPKRSARSARANKTGNDDSSAAAADSSSDSNKPVESSS